ncbi:PLP-dependent aminotransferase family protein [Oscillochloris sp. ZM17-4]|uniref:MocR-like pyridoxine biosynthesis transcription factor PdxR n=1 Tax=Oscillochloris sp. ZM17-4 TaxID=2866714 RepID=UPI001C73D2A8|nr:PLP-dependent aminotransferase family protein [Oscillochloris sp. ZM17-4]MBX0327137.1 PLP-dependent aminotransferase family protein [Oscillochloris sp. ZM17-4]
MQIDVDRSSREPIYRQLAAGLQQRIRSGALPPQTRLPTVRQLAEQLGVTRLTVHSAYAELQSGGWVEATVGRGTFVAAQIEGLIAPPEAQLGRELTPAGMVADILRMSQLPGMISMAKADPAHEFFPLRNWQRAMEQAMESGGPLMMGYTTAQGDLRLRSTLAEVIRERGVSAGPDEIIVTAGVTNGMALITDLLTRPGDTVLVEQPTYLGMLNILSSRGVRAVGLPVDGEGLVIEALEAALRRERPAYLYTIPTFQNPSGVSMRPERRAALLDLAERHGLTVVEDDIYGRLSYEGAAPPALKAADRSGRVIYMSSFSKSLMPGLRIGYIAAAPELIRKLVYLRQAQDLCSPPLTQRALALFIEQGWWHSHMKRMLPRYRERRDALVGAMERFFPAEVRWTRPQGGFSCWVTLPPGTAVTDLYMIAISRGVAFTPGAVFSATPNPEPHLRFCFSAEPPERLADAVASLGGLLRERGGGRSLAAPALSDYVPVV